MLSEEDNVFPNNEFPSITASPTLDNTSPWEPSNSKAMGFYYRSRQGNLGYRLDSRWTASSNSKLPRAEAYGVLCRGSQIDLSLEFFDIHDWYDQPLEYIPRSITRKNGLHQFNNKKIEPYLPISSVHSQVLDEQHQHYLLYWHSFIYILYLLEWLFSIL
jgi:hypothetical protein